MEIKRKKLLRPARLIRGDTIGIVAPASPFDKVKFNQGIAALESMGFRTSVSDDLFITNGYLAGTDRHRANMVNRLFADKTIKAVVCAKGGFGSLRMLSLLDFQLIGRNPKIFVGFSDISALLFVLFAKCGLVTFHGPMVTTLADATEETKNNMFLTITSDIMPKLKPKKGRVFSFSVPDPGDNPSFFIFSLHKCGSTLLMQLLHDVCRIINMPVVDLNTKIFNLGIQANLLTEDINGIWNKQGYAYLGFRSFFPALDFDFTQTKNILLIRDPRDMLVSYQVPDVSNIPEEAWDREQGYGYPKDL